MGRFLREICIVLLISLFGSLFFIPLYLATHPTELEFPFYFIPWILVIVIVGTYLEMLLITINLPVVPGEKIIKSGNAGLKYIFWFGKGRLFLTNKRLVHIKHYARFQYPPEIIEIPIEETTSINASYFWGLKDGICVKYNGIAYIFGVYNPDQWIESIANTRKLASVNTHKG